MNSMPDDILVAVYMITYNHANFIQQAVESVMSQQTNFNYKLFIGDDNSTDDTGAICQKLALEHPGSIQLTIHPKNIGASNNAIQILRQCFNSGAKYIAILEGDDYWTESSKLQKFVDFFESNPNYSICFHRVTELNNGRLSVYNLNTETEEQTFTIRDLAMRNFICTPSVMFRNKLFDKLPDWYTSSPAGDYVLHMLNAKYGLIKYFPEPMAVYRIHSTGIWTSTQELGRDEKMVALLTYLLREDFNDDVTAILHKQLLKYKERLLKGLMKLNDWQDFLKKLALYSSGDEYISQKWLLEYYPKYITSLKSSRAYRLSGYLKKIKHLFKK